MEELDRLWWREVSACVDQVVSISGCGDIWGKTNDDLDASDVGHHKPMHLLWFSIPGITNQINEQSYVI